MPPDSRQPRAPLRSTLDRPPGRPNSSIATAPGPGAQQGATQFRSDLITFISKVGPSEKLYSGDRTWARITVTLETAGPVAIGTKANITPVLSGKGILLRTGVPKTFDIAKGDNLYIASNAVSRLSLEIQPLPWLEQMAGSISMVADAIIKLLQSVTRKG